MRCSGGFAASKRRTAKSPPFSKHADGARAAFSSFLLRIEADEILPVGGAPGTGQSFLPRDSTKLPPQYTRWGGKIKAVFGFGPCGRIARRRTDGGANCNFFELSAHYNLHHFWAECKRTAPNFRQFFGETSEHFFNKRLEICMSVCYNGLCKQPKAWAFL